jgi:hypothetical protein
MVRNARKSDNCISAGREEKLMRINAFILVQFPVAIDIDINPQCGHGEKFLILSVRFWNCYF